MKGNLGSSSYLGTGTRYGLAVLHQYGKKVKTKSQKVLGANSNISRSYRGKAGRGRGSFLLTRIWSDFGLKIFSML